MNVIFKKIYIKIVHLPNRQALKSENEKLQSELKMSKTSVNEEKSLRLFQEKRVKDLENKLVIVDQEMDQQKATSQNEMQNYIEEIEDLQKQVGLFFTNLKTTIFLIFVGRKKSILFYLYFGVFCWWVFCFFLIKISELEKDIRESVCKERKLEHDCEELRSQVDLLKDEAASHIEHIHSLKDSNFKLTDGLEEAISKGEAFKSRWDFCSLKQLFFFKL